MTERKPKSSKEAGELAENYLQAPSITSPHIPSVNTEKPPTTKCPKCNEMGHWARDCPNSSRPKLPEGSNTEGNKPQVRCFLCNQKGHLSINCPQKASFYCDRGGAATSLSQMCKKGYVNNVPCDIVLDTGTNQSMVHTDYVKGDDLTGNHATIYCAHGDAVTYPTARVRFCVAGREVTAQAAVSGTLPRAALVGWDVPHLLDLIYVEPEEANEQLSARVGIGTPLSDVEAKHPSAPG